ncbi:hypothetical protein PybrP1_000786 [[Pythium] brassicae (nom. inval.)]|nr:hypothetical protein PybrP1_000786 [[Pythium] brassicae (nom. inval.)]
MTHPSERAIVENYFGPLCICVCVCGGGEHLRRQVRDTDGEEFIRTQKHLIEIETETERRKSPTRGNNRCRQHYLFQIYLDNIPG